MNFFTNISQNARVHIIYLTFNRLYYTKKTLPALLNSSNLTSYKIRIVDNGSNDGTVEYLQQLTHPRIEQVIYNKKNSIIELFENVKIIRGNEIITGDYGTLDTDTNSYKVKSNNSNKVKVIITENNE